MTRVLRGLLFFVLLFFVASVGVRASSSFSQLEKRDAVFRADNNFSSLLFADLLQQFTNEARRIGKSSGEPLKVTVAIEEKYINDFFASTRLSPVQKIYFSLAPNNNIYTRITLEEGKNILPMMFATHFTYSLPERFRMRFDNFQFGPFGVSPSVIKTVPPIIAGALNASIISMEQKYSIKVLDVQTSQGKLLISLGTSEELVTVPEFDELNQKALTFQYAKPVSIYQLNKKLFQTKAKNLLAGADKDSHIRLELDQNNFNTKTNFEKDNYSIFGLLPQGGETLGWLQTDLLEAPIMAKMKMGYSPDGQLTMELLNLQLGQTPLPVGWFKDEKKLFTEVLMNAADKEGKRMGLLLKEAKIVKGKVVFDLEIVDPQLLLTELAKY